MRNTREVIRRIYVQAPTGRKVREWSKRCRAKVSVEKNIEPPRLTEITPGRNPTGRALIKTRN